MKAGQRLYRVTRLRNLEEQQDRNMYLLLYLSIYLPPCYRERLALLEKKMLTLYGPMTSLKFQFWPMTTYTGVIRETA